MRASLTRILNTAHNPDCTCRVTGFIEYACTPGCGIAALGKGDSSEGVAVWVRAAARVLSKLANRRQRMTRKKRRGWA